MNGRIYDPLLGRLAEGIESLAPIAKQIVIPISPRSSPRFSGQSGVLLSKAVQPEKSAPKDFVSEVIESEDGCHALAHTVQTCPNSDLVPRVGVEPTRYRYR